MLEQRVESLSGERSRVSLTRSPLIICGHPRSGTSLLNRLCNAHPAIAMTFEFRSFWALDVPYSEHVWAIRKNWVKRPIVRIPGERGKLRACTNSAVFLTRYLTGLLGFGRWQVDVSMVTDVLHQIFPWASIVGDKKPNYILCLDRLLSFEALSCLVIYRDARDVVSSVLQKSRTRPWNNTWRRLNTAEKAAQSWVSAIETMQRHADSVYPICYEDLVTEPQYVLKLLGNWLAVDPLGFRQRGVHAKSVGKHTSGLSQQALATVMEVAGPTMARLGYL